MSNTIAEWVILGRVQGGWFGSLVVSMQKGLYSNRSRDTHRASVHQAAKLVATFLRVARVTAGLAESNGSLPPGL